MEFVFLFISWFIGAVVGSWIVSFMTKNRWSSDDLALWMTQLSSQQAQRDQETRQLYREYIQDLKGDLTTALAQTSSTLISTHEALLTVVKDTLNSLSLRVDQRLEAEFTKTQATFSSLMERLIKIDEAQKNLDALSKDLVSLHTVLTDSKTRGVFGEVQLGMLLDKVFWSWSSLFSLQYTYPSKVIVDCVIHTKQGLIPIDSKFSLVLYQAIHDASDSAAQKTARTSFAKAIKKQIDDIASKYIDPPLTVDHAFLFVPAEAVFAEIFAHHHDVVEYAFWRKVSIVWPSTMMATLSLVMMTIASYKTQEFARVIHDHLTWLATEFDRFWHRWKKFCSDYQRVNDDIKHLDITTDKIVTKFTSLRRLDFPSLADDPHHQR